MSQGFKNEIIIADLGSSAFSVMDDCMRFGIVSGCTVECPVLLRGECELQDGENKQLYEEAIS